MVKKAAKFAVYEETIIRVKKHHIAATVLVDKALNKRIKNISLERTTWFNIFCYIYFGATSEPCCKSAPVVNHRALFIVN